MSDQSLEMDQVSEAAAAEVEKAWSNVFKIVNKVISQHDRFGFKLIESSINPSFQVILLNLKMMEALLDAIFTEDNLDYDLSRLTLNAKHQITHVELMVTALKHGKQEDYEAALSRLRKQAQF